MHFDLDFFAALRRMKDRRAERTDAAQPMPAPLPPIAPDTTPRTIGAPGMALIKRFEGCALLRSDGRYQAYPDPGTGGDPWTIGWGATGKGIRRGLVWSREQCDLRLEADLTRFAREVDRALGSAPTSPAQFDALASFHYNTGAIARATLTRLHKTGKFDEAAAQFGKWVHAGGKRLTGLVRRRAAEAALYRNG